MAASHARMSRTCAVFNLDHLWIDPDLKMHLHEAAEGKPVFLGRRGMCAVQALILASQLLRDSRMNVQAKNLGKPADRGAVHGMNPHRSPICTYLDLAERIFVGCRFH